MLGSEVVWKEWRLGNVSCLGFSTEAGDYYLGRRGEDDGDFVHAVPRQGDRMMIGFTPAGAETFKEWGVVGSFDEANQWVRRREGVSTPGQEFTGTAFNRNGDATVPEDRPPSDTVTYDGAHEVYRTAIHYIREAGRRDPLDGPLWDVCPDGSTDVMFTGSLHDCIQAALGVEEDL
jgi:hypothetical protein